MLQSKIKYKELEIMTGNPSVHKFNKPRKFVPKPLLSDYEKGIIDRYFAVKINDGTIIEIDKIQYDLLRTKSKNGIDYNLYKSLMLKWKISGPKHDIYKNNIIIKHGVEDTNKRTIEKLAKNTPQVLNYFKNKLEYYIDIN